MIVTVVGLAFEAELLQGRACMLFAEAPASPSWHRSIKPSEEGTTALSVGVAGGLSPDCRPGPVL
jgi:hypothetical protein